MSKQSLNIQQEAYPYLEQQQLFNKTTQFQLQIEEEEQVAIQNNQTIQLKTIAKQVIANVWKVLQQAQKNFQKQQQQQQSQKQKERNVLLARLSVGYVLVDGQEVKKEQKDQKSQLIIKSQQKLKDMNAQLQQKQQLLKYQENMYQNNNNQISGKQQEQQHQQLLQLQKKDDSDQQFLKSPEDLQIATTQENLLAIVPYDQHQQQQSQEQQPQVSQFPLGRHSMYIGGTWLAGATAIGTGAFAGYLAGSAIYTISVKEEEQNNIYKKVPNLMIQTAGTVGGTVSGAMYGASVGTIIGGPIGTVVGAGVGMFGGSTGGYVAKKLMPWNWW